MWMVFKNFDGRITQLLGRIPSAVYKGYLDSTRNNRLHVDFMGFAVNETFPKIVIKEFFFKFC